MSVFKKTRTLMISEPDPTYKVRYLGNVLTAFVKGDGCVDRPTVVLWNNYSATSASGTAAGLEMELTVCNSGLKVITKEQGLTEYRAHRITYNICPEQYPKLFVWVYKHEGKKLKAEVRCHAVLCKSEMIAQTIASQLHERLAVALDEFMREKRRNQNSRLSIKQHHHTSPLPNDITNHGGSLVRTKFLKLGQNFRPSIDHSNSAPKLDSITEGDEPAADSAADDDVDNLVTSQPECDGEVDSVFSSSSHSHSSNGHVSRSDVANDDDITSSLSSLEVTCHGGSDISACVEMLPAAGGVESEDENENDEHIESEQLS